MTWSAFIRALSLVVGIAMIITDYGLDLWAKPPGSAVYLLIAAIAVGVDADWLRETLKSLILKALGIEKDPR